jgi:hypothetical protein
MQEFSHEGAVLATLGSGVARQAKSGERPPTLTIFFAIEWKCVV